MITSVGTRGRGICGRLGVTMHQAEKIIGWHVGTD